MENSLQLIKKESLRIERKKIINYIILIVVSILICWQSDFNPFLGKELPMDGAVFMYIGKAMKNGQMPYKDIFDHKGPLLYLINFIGCIFDTPTRHVGIWIIEIIVLAITLIYMHKISKMFIKNNIISIMIVILVIMPISKYLDGGNYTEEYALPFITISLYYMIKYIVQTQTIAKKESFIIGICMSCVLLLRPNMISIYIVYCSMIFIHMIINKKYELAKNTVIYFLLGTFSILVTCMVIFLANGMFQEFINQYLIFNCEYAVSLSKGKLFSSMLKFIKMAPLVLVSIVLCIIDIIYKINKKQDVFLSISSLVYIMLTFFIIIIPGRIYGHYSMTLIPTFLVPILMGTTYVLNHKIQLGIFITLLIFLNQASLYKMYKEYMNPKLEDEQDKQIVEIVKKETSEQDKIIVLGNSCDIYLKSNRQAGLKYVYQIPIIEIDEQRKQEVLKSLENTDVAMIVMNKKQCMGIQGIGMMTVLCKLVEQNKYTLIENIEKFEILKKVPESMVTAFETVKNII